MIRFFVNQMMKTILLHQPFHNPPNKPFNKQFHLQFHQMLLSPFQLLMLKLVWKIQKTFHPMSLMDKLMELNLMLKIPFHKIKLQPSTIPSIPLEMKQLSKMMKMVSCLLIIIIIPLIHIYVSFNDNKQMMMMNRLHHLINKKLYHLKFQLLQYISIITIIVIIIIVICLIGKKRKFIKFECQK